MDMLKTVSQAFKVPEMRKKIIFTILMLVIFRVGSCIPVPGMNREALGAIFSGDNGLFNLFDLFSGGSFSNYTIFALSITPYITASIIIQLLAMAFPYFQRLAQEGAEGRKKMTQITRYLTIVLALIQATGLTVGLFRRAVADQNVFNFIVIIMVLTAGTAFLMWLGEQINENGIGNGISLLIFAGIISRIPTDIRGIWDQYRDGGISLLALILFAAFAIIVILGVILINQGTRKIPVRYAKRVVGRKMYGGQSTHIPLKVNQAGVIPVIFALSILQFPLTITYFLSADSGFTAFVSKWLSPNGSPGVWVYAVLNVLLIIAFNFFYTTATFNPIDVAQNLKSNGGVIPGINPGRATVGYLQKTMNRLALVGAIFLAAIATLPTLISQYTGMNIRFGGTSLIIVVGVAIETMRALENQMVMRNYKGFLK